MEYKFVLALQYPVYPLGENTHYFATMVKYMELYANEFDVVNDMRPYFELFGQSEAAALKGFVRT
jgi:hypothetical protein